MSIEAGLRAVLTGDAGVAALVGGRIYPLRLPAKPIWPAIRYARVSTVLDRTVDGSLGRKVARFQIDCWDETPDGADTLARAVEAALAAFSGTSAGARILHSRLDNEQQAVEGKPTLYRVIQDFIVTYAE
jgi:hypothetical protein